MKNALQKINQLKQQLDFIINGGDSIMDALAATKENTKIQWELFDKIMGEENKLPVKHCMGNHDIWGWQLKEDIKADALYGKAWWLQRTGGAAWTLYAWATGEVLLLTTVIFSGDGARSGLTPAMFVLVAASSLRYRALLIGYVTVLTMLSYGFIWVHTVVIRQQTVGALTGIPVLLAFALIGVVQYIALNRSSASFEATGEGLPRKISRS